MGSAVADPAPPPEEANSFAHTAKDLFSGAAGGVAQVLLGQPFDIVKVRLQTTSQYPNAFAAAKSIYQHEGPLAFFKGTLTPLLGIGACVSVQFGGFNWARRSFESANLSNGRPLDLSLKQIYGAGAFAGLANTFLSCPIEHIRIRLQTQPHTTGQRLYLGPVDCVRKLIQQKSLYRGLTVTTFREAQAYGMWFLAFESAMRSAAPGRGGRENIPTWEIAAYGGLAGEALWISSYPFDVVKSRMQTDGLGKAKKFVSTRDCFVQTWKEAGFGGFWKGIGPTLLRAMPVSAGTFAV
ncbi:MAG: hypothetical protein M1814_002568 [Vezdaea aestivalis]|nr:MAG: hypothetical protein M1814_002568 [Vezdaea aestivalis]